MLESWHRYACRGHLGRIIARLITESDSSFKGYANGNEEPGRGFGHICISVDNLDAACKRFDDLGVKFKKRPEEGRMRNIAFIYDPDNYWVEILEHNADV